MADEKVEHPGVILQRMLDEKGISKRELALFIGEYPQLLGEVTLGKRKMNPSLSVRIGRALGLDEEYLMMLQTKYDIAQEQGKEQYKHIVRLRE